REALTYYRKVAEYFELDVRQYHEVQGVRRSREGFELAARHPGKTEPETVSARNVVYATGYFESPNPLGVPGEDLPHVSHFFTEAHPYWQQRVIVVGGGNSAVEAALALHRGVAGVYVAGVLASGLDANKIFIENGRAHGGLICGHIQANPPRVAPGG